MREVPERRMSQLRSDATHQPTCRCCGDRLKPYIYFGDSVIDPKKEKRLGYEGNGIYCTLRCGFRDAVDLVRKHYR